MRLTLVHLPGLNTPQFGWVRARVPHQPRPVPPVYQPEVAARAIRWAADHPERREYFLGAATVGAVWGNCFVAGLLDRYLAKTNVTAQQTGKRLPADRPDDLFAPVDEDRGAHGAFGGEAHGRSPQFWLSQRRRVAGTAAGIATLVWLSQRSDPQPRKERP